MDERETEWKGKRGRRRGGLMHNSLEPVGSLTSHFSSGVAVARVAVAFVGVQPLRSTKSAFLKSNSNAGKVLHPKYSTS